MGTETEVAIKFKTARKYGYGPLTFIVGQNPGRQHRGKETYTVWEGNRSGDFIKEIMMSSDFINVFMTNICNYQKMTPERIRDGKKDLQRDIRTLQPSKIICLGLFAYSHIMELDPCGARVQVFHHPSFVLRFNKGQEAYKKKLKEELEWELS